jgi:hypothetical protein
MAVQRRCPKPGLLHHSDRGCTYTCEDYQTYLAAHGITCSMSRRADCYDNAVMEAFFSTVKREEADRFQGRPTFAPDRINGARYGVEFDRDDLLQMDTAARVEAGARSIGCGGLSPIEARKRYWDVGPVPGGETPYLQEQNWPLRHLAERPLPARPVTAPDDIKDVTGAWQLVDYPRGGPGAKIWKQLGEIEPSTESSR